MEYLIPTLRLFFPLLEHTHSCSDEYIAAKSQKDEGLPRDPGRESQLREKGRETRDGKNQRGTYSAMLDREDRKATCSLLASIFRKEETGRHGMLYALCGLSGSGKTTLLEAVLRRAPHLTRMVTFTTRLPRSGEVPDRAYHFLTEEVFHARVENGELVCSIQYRGFSYATAQADLNACARRATLTVLRPDKLACLAAYTPIIGIYLEMVGRETPNSEEDQIIFEHRQCCHYRVANIPGHLDWAVATLLGILHKHDQEDMSHGRSVLLHPHSA